MRYTNVLPCYRTCPTISATSHHVFRLVLYCTLVIRSRTSFFCPTLISGIGILARIVSAASTSDWSIHTCTSAKVAHLLVYPVLSIAITKTIRRRRDIALLSAAVRVLRHGALLLTSIEGLCCIPRPTRTRVLTVRSRADIYEQGTR
jgi:hypothetical protein